MAMPKTTMIDIEDKPSSLWRDAWRRLKRNRLAVAGLVTLAGVAVVPVMFFLFNSVGIGTLGSNVVLGMMLGALGFMWLGLVLHGALALTLRPLLLFGFSLADRALAQRGDGVESPP